MIKPNLLRAARALLDWSLQDLADRSGLSAQAISNHETGRSTFQAESENAILAALDKAGIEFTATGVQMKTTPVYYHEGDGWYVKLLDDAYETLLDKPGAEIMMENVDDRKSSPEVLARLRKIRNGGIALRMTTVEGNTYLAAPSKCYRFLKEKFFKNWVFMIFGNKVAISVAGESRCMVICDGDLSTAMKNRFDMVWDIFPELDIASTAHERI